MNINNLSIFEMEALLVFLQDYINRDSLSIYEGAEVRHLFLAYLKIQKAIEEWHKTIQPSE